jgi:predicted DNA-binding transcriptional regulator AlpA
MAKSVDQPTDDIVVRPGARLLSKGDVLDKVGVTYPTIWKLMRQGTFPRSVVVGGKVAWLEHEVDEFIAKLPRRRLKGHNDGVPYRKAEAVA